MNDVVVVVVMFGLLELVVKMKIESEKNQMYENMFSLTKVLQ